MEVLGTKCIQKDMERPLLKDKEKKVPEDTETTHWRPSCVPLSLHGLNGGHRRQPAGSECIPHLSPIPVLWDPGPHTQPQGDKGHLLQLDS